MSLRTYPTSTAEPVQFVGPDGTFHPTATAAPYEDAIASLGEDDLRRFHRDMALSRALDVECTNLQRQGQLALWPPSQGQEAAQVGSARAARRQDHVFPAYREHVVGMIRGIDPLRIVALMRGVTNGGWDPTDPASGNFHLYTLVIGSQTLHATGYAMGQTLDGATGTGDPERDEASIVYFGDGSTSQGDVNEALVFAASYQAPLVFFLQNNHWAISVPVSRQSRVPLYQRGDGFGVPSVQIDGNDVLASYAVARTALDAARSGEGPQLIEALTYRIGAHTTSDDPTRYRPDGELEYWQARDPLLRFEAFLRARGAEEAFFESVASDAADLAADIRRRTVALAAPEARTMFETVYSDPHPVTAAQADWLEDYEASMEENG